MSIEELTKAIGRELTERERIVHNVMARGGDYSCLVKDGEIKYNKLNDGYGYDR